MRYCSDERGEEVLLTFGEQSPENIEVLISPDEEPNTRVDTRGMAHTRWLETASHKTAGSM